MATDASHSRARRTPPPMAVCHQVEPRRMTESHSQDRPIVFIGGVIPRKHRDVSPVDLERYGDLDNAAQTYQWNLITGLESNLDRPVRIISAPFIDARPGAPRRVPGFRWKHSEGDVDLSVGFTNIPGIRNLTREFALTRALSRSAISHLTPDASPIIIAYSMHGPYMQQVARIKRRCPNATTCLVVPDLPEHMRDPSKTSSVLKILKSIDVARNKPCLQFVDKFVVITEHQAEALGLDPGCFITVEGMVNTNERIDAAPTESSPQFTIVYTGNVAARYGIVELVDSLDYLHSPNVRLVICGDGDTATYVENKASRDSRLTYLGRVSRQDAIGWQRQASLLVNPRPDTEQFTKYSFPSKTLEYMLTGRPVIVYLNPGIPAEYAAHLIAIRETGSRGIADAIGRAMSMSAAERAQFGERAQRFVLDEKSSTRQAARVLDLLGIAP